MGLIDFIKDAGAYLFGSHAGTAVAATKAEPVTVDILRKQIETIGVPVKDLSLTFDDPIASVGGVVPTQADREKVVLAIGNTPGVAKVDDLLIAEQAAPAAAPPMQTYTVKKGDTLSAISKSVYGNANKYQRIFEANTPMLKDPDKIYPGQVLRIPPAS